MRLVLLAILNGRLDDFMIHFGLVCSSFVTISKGTHWRCPTFPLGMENVRFVREGNEFTSKIFGFFCVGDWLVGIRTRELLGG